MFQSQTYSPGYTYSEIVLIRLKAIYCPGILIQDPSPFDIFENFISSLGANLQKMCNAQCYGSMQKTVECANRHATIALSHKRVAAKIDGVVLFCSSIHAAVYTIIFLIYHLLLLQTISWHVRNAVYESCFCSSSTFGYQFRCPSHVGMYFGMKSVDNYLSTGTYTANKWNTFKLCLCAQNVTETK